MLRVTYDVSLMFVDAYRDSDDHFGNVSVNRTIKHIPTYEANI